MRIKEAAECSICAEELVAPCPVTLLACNENHFFHTECVDGWIAHNKKNNKMASCPLCRVNVDESTLKRLQFKGVEAPPSVPEAEMTDMQRAQHKEAELADIFGGPSVAPPAQYGAGPADNQYQGNPSTVGLYNPNVDAPPVMPPQDPYGRSDEPYQQQNVEVSGPAGDAGAGGYGGGNGGGYGGDGGYGGGGDAGGDAGGAD